MIIIACDSFKGCLSSTQVADALAQGIRETHPDAQIHSVGIADGGEGTMRTLTEALHGRFISMSAHDALMRPITAEYGLLDDGTAIIDMAETGGLTRIRPEERDPMAATSYGLGEQIAHALQQGCTKLLIGLGGSATTDAGAGMLEALQTISLPTGGSWRGASVLCDVTNPLYGPQGAAYIFSPQKGATSEQVKQLDDRLRAFAAASPHPERALTLGAGAAGGLGFALLCYLNATLVPGIETVLQYQHFDALLHSPNRGEPEGGFLVITGEGKMDAQTLMNKAPFGVLQHCLKAGIPCIGIAGRVEQRDTLLQAGFHDVMSINPPDTPLELAMQPSFAQQRLRLIGAQISMHHAQ